MEIIKLLAIVLCCFFLIVCIYVILIWFIELIQRHHINKSIYKELRAQLKEDIKSISSILINDNTIENNTLLDKSDEELIQEWSDAWDGNPPCELDIDAIRKSEKEEGE